MVLNHPSLRYGGYCIIIIIFPTSNFLELITLLINLELKFLLIAMSFGNLSF